MNFTYLKPAAQNANRQLGGRTENWEAIATQFTQEKGPKWWDNPTAPFNVGNTKSNGKTFDEFPSLDAGVNGYVNFLMNDPAGYYAEVRKAIREGTPNDVLVALSKCPYCYPPYPFTELEGVYNELFGAPAQQPKEATNVTATYQTFEVKVMGHPFEAIGVPVNGTTETRVLYTALDFLQTPYRLEVPNGHYTGVILIDGHDVQCTQYNGTTYVPWSDLAPGIHATHDGNEWNFVLDAPTIDPNSVVAVVHGVIWQGAFQFHLDLGNGKGMDNVVLDTGAYELAIPGSYATLMQQEGLLPNLGSEQAVGVGGTVDAYDSELDFVFDSTTFTKQPCVVVPSYQGYPLFGLRFFGQNNLKLALDLKACTLTIYK